MKKLLLTVLAALLASGAMAQDPPFPDIPAGHWASDAVARIADLGIVIGFPDGTFRGNEAFTRYQAALVISRLLDVISEDIAAAQALTDQDIASLRNALQELAADVAAQGVAIATIADQVNANTADIAELLRQGGIDPEALRDLQNQLEALRVASDAAQARAESAEALANQALDRIDALEAQVAQNSAAIDALNDLVALLAGDLEGIDFSFLDRIAQNEADIANIREFVILLRRDQVALRERVVALEANDALQDERLDNLDERLTAVEEQLITFSGSIGIEYVVSRLSGSEVAFDVDRIFGIGLDREAGDEEFSFAGARSLFSTGADDENDDDDETDDGEVPQDRADIDFEAGNLNPVLELNIGFSLDRGLTGLFNTFETNVALELKEAFNLCEEDVAAAACDDFFDGYVFTVEGFETTFGLIGAEPLTFIFGEDPDVEFTPYVFESLGTGFGAFIGTPDFLSFLQPTLTLAYGRYEEEGSDKPENDDFELPVDDFFGAGENDVNAPGENPFNDAYYRAIRGTLTPFEGENFAATGGFSFAQLTGNADENADAADDNLGITVFGFDGLVSLSVFDIAFEYASNSIDEGVVFPIADVEDATFDATPDIEGDPDVDCVAADGTIAAECTVPVDDSSLFYVQVSAGSEDEPIGIPLLEEVTANYRSIPQFWVGLKYDQEDYPFDLDQTGFGVRATLQLFIVEIEGFIDSYTVAAGDDVFAFGVTAGVEIFRGIEVFGFYAAATVNGDLVNNIPSALERVDDYTTGFGVGIEHDGEAEDALVPGLNFRVAYDFGDGSVASSGLAAEADFVLVVGPLAFDPYLFYESDVDPALLSDDTTTFKVGTGLVTEPFDFFLSPSFIANVNYRTTSHTDTDPDTDAGELAGDFTATEFQFSVGVAFNEFLFDNSVLVARYGVYTGTNISLDYEPPGFGDDEATNISEGDFNNGVTQTTSGYEIGWQYYGLEFAYGAYLNDRGDIASGGQAFRIQYEVTF